MLALSSYDVSKNVLHAETTRLASIMTRVGRRLKNHIGKLDGRGVPDEGTRETLRWYKRPARLSSRHRARGARGDGLRVSPHGNTTAGSRAPRAPSRLRRASRESRPFAREVLCTCPDVDMQEVLETTSETADSPYDFEGFSVSFANGLFSVACHVRNYVQESQSTQSTQ